MAKQDLLGRSERAAWRKGRLSWACLWDELELGRQMVGGLLLRETNLVTSSVQSEPRAAPTGGIIGLFPSFLKS